MMEKRLPVVLLFCLACLPAYGAGGHLEIKGLHFPNNEDIFEFRSRLFGEQKFTLGDRVTVYGSGYLEGLVSDRPGQETDFIARIDDAYLNFYLPQVDCKVGYSKLVWGKLDDLSVVDIVNPLDGARLFLEAERKQAKLPVPLVMLSPYWGEMDLDFIVVPFFREAVYDSLAEESSPFNTAEFSLPSEVEVPAKDPHHVEYGARFASSLGQVDYSLYYFKGFSDRPGYQLVFPPLKASGRYIKGEMIGYDFETVLGRFGLRGEGAFFDNDVLWRRDSLDYVIGKSFAVGLGLDRTFRDNYLSLNAVYRKILVDHTIREPKNELSLSLNFERKFAYDTKEVKLLSTYNIEGQSAFIRGVFSLTLWENFWADFTVGIFSGRSPDTLSTFKDCDFVSSGFRYDF